VAKHAPQARTSGRPSTAIPVPAHLACPLGMPSRAPSRMLEFCTKRATDARLTEVHPIRRRGVRLAVQLAHLREDTVLIPWGRSPRARRQDQYSAHPAHLWYPVALLVGCRVLHVCPSGGTSDAPSRVPDQVSPPQGVSRICPRRPTNNLKLLTRPSTSLIAPTPKRKKRSRNKSATSLMPTQKIQQRTYPRVISPKAVNNQQRNLPE
jgi:hypothetical protein